MTVATPRALGGRYELAERIATGGMGEVWRARDTTLGRWVAVKTLRPEYVDEPDFLARFRAEARHSAGLDHPGIARVYDYGEASDPAGGVLPFLVMELVVGEPLSQVLARRGRLDVLTALSVVGQVALALQAAHDAGVVHRDVKPGNLLLRTDGVVKVTDFGIARMVGAAPLTRAGSVLGTAYYLSPEQTRAEPATPASDLYSLGVVAYEALAGRRPFPGDDPAAVALAHRDTPPPPLPDDVPELVADLVLGALAKDPARRGGPAARFGRTALALRDALAPSPPVVAGVPALGPHGTRSFAADTLTMGTALAGAAGAGSARGGAAAGPSTPPAARHGRRRSRAPLIGLVALATLLAVVASLPGATPRVRLPRLIGLTTQRAQTVLASEHLRSQVRTRITSSGVGKVLATQPGAGTQLARGDLVILIVGAARPSVLVDAAAYVGHPVDTVLAALDQLGLRTRLEVPTTGRPTGSVASVTPNGRLAAGSTVTVIESATSPATRTANAPGAPGAHPPGGAAGAGGPGGNGPGGNGPGAQGANDG